LWLREAVGNNVVDWCFSSPNDRELFVLANYLVLIAQREADFSKVNHKKWKRYERKHRKEPDNNNNNNSSNSNDMFQSLS